MVRWELFEILNEGLRNGGIKNFEFFSQEVPATYVIEEK